MFIHATYFTNYCNLIWHNFRLHYTFKSYDFGVLFRWRSNLCHSHVETHSIVYVVIWKMPWEALAIPWQPKKYRAFYKKRPGPTYVLRRGAFGDSLLTGWIIIRFRPISSFYKVFPWWFTGKSFELFGLKVSYFTYQNEKSFGKMVVLSFTLIWKFCYLALLLLWNFDFEH